MKKEREEMKGKLKKPRRQRNNEGEIQSSFDRRIVGPSTGGQERRSSTAGMFKAKKRRKMSLMGTSSKASRRL